MPGTRHGTLALPSPGQGKSHRIAQPTTFPGRCDCSTQRVLSLGSSQLAFLPAQDLGRARPQGTGTQQKWAWRFQVTRGFPVSRVASRASCLCLCRTRVRRDSTSTGSKRSSEARAGRGGVATATTGQTTRARVALCQAHTRLSLHWRDRGGGGQLGWMGKALEVLREERARVRRRDHMGPHTPSPGHPERAPQASRAGVTRLRPGLQNCPSLSCRGSTDPV